MKFWCKVSYEAEFDADESIKEFMEEGYTKEQAMKIYSDDIESSIIDSIDCRADDKFWRPYVRKFESKWSSDENEI